MKSEQKFENFCESENLYLSDVTKKSFKMKVKIAITKKVDQVSIYPIALD